MTLIKRMIDDNNFRPALKEILKNDNIVQLDQTVYEPFDDTIVLIFSILYDCGYEYIIVHDVKYNGENEIDDDNIKSIIDDIDDNFIEIK